MSKLWQMKLSFLVVAVLLVGNASAHPGGRDSNGGHVDRATGVYHCHDKGCVLPGSLDSAESTTLWGPRESTLYAIVLVIAVILTFFIWSMRRKLFSFIQSIKRSVAAASNKTESDLSSAVDATATHRQGIMEIGVSDAALDNPEDDLIGTGRLAKGLSEFLSHNQTDPPLTLAITGPWGSGKSSIMGMLQAFTRQARYRPVWFNVWHHQDEEHFFGALLENIRKDGIRPLWHFSGLEFRVRLMAVRLARRPMVLGLLGLLLLLAIFSDPLLSLLSLDMWSLQFQFLAAVMAGFTILDQFTAFGFSSKDLIQGLASSFKSINFEADAGLRYKVRECLQDIQKAMGDRPIVIFIDDLDRCPADHVLKVLEIVNFLSSPPLKFFIVFGISIDTVIPLISPTFAKQVEEEFPAQPGQDEARHKTVLRAERLKLARHYLRKMINIEVSVPATSVQDLRKLAEQNPTIESIPQTEQDDANRRANFLDRVIFPASAAILLGGFLALGPFEGLDQLSTLASTYFPSNQTEQVSGSGGGDPADTSTGSTAGVESESDDAASGEKTGGEQPTESRYLFVPFVVAVIVGVVVLNTLLRRQTKRSEIDDSETFLKALDIWAPVLNSLDATPRHYIRMVNQLRLLSMRMRIELNGKSSEVDATLSKEKTTEKCPDGVQQVSLPMEDRKIVHTTVLCALHEIGVDLAKFIMKVRSLAMDANIEKVVHDLLLPEMTSDEVSRVHDTLTTAIKKHEHAFQDVWPDNTDIEEFHSFVNGLQLS
ncbi:MAG: P-loop NTPase fold protein [Candidatus Poribacteria bacterium]|nr:P-loop NTPase fold protein [Candidatus Poribacteria bacterium]